MWLYYNFKEWRNSYVLHSTYSLPTPAVADLLPTISSSLNLWRGLQEDQEMGGMTDFLFFMERNLHRQGPPHAWFGGTIGSFGVDENYNYKQHYTSLKMMKIHGFEGPF